MPKVEVAEGVLDGLWETNKYGGDFYSFRGIPYAEPPIGELRFKAPQPKQPWEGIRMAKEHGPICYQYNTILSEIKQGSEDCLYLNVYTPEIKPAKLLPVMFWIHGGAFTSGSGNDDMYGPEFLLKQGVILVTINYRLEVLGFLCLDTKDAPGNAGMKDQVAALRWVRNNIIKFGGDPDNITIFGESAGAASVSLHCISPMSKGLFKRAIMQSGCATCWLSNMYFPRERSFTLAKELGCDSDDESLVFNFLKSQPVENLIKKDIKLLLVENMKKNLNPSFTIVREKEFEGVERFLFEDVYDAYRNGVHEGVEIMNGYNKDEGFLFIFANNNIKELFIEANKYPEYFVPKPLEVDCPARVNMEIGKKIKKFYFKDKEVSQDTLEQFSRFFNGQLFIHPALALQKMLAKLNKNKLYLYKFTCKSERNVFAHLTGVSHMLREKSVVYHGDDLLYIFPFKALKQNIGIHSKVFQIITGVTKLWTNFAKFGDPTPDGCSETKWLPYTQAEENYMDIGQNLKPGHSLDAEDFEFWNEIYKEYYPHFAI